MRAYTICPYKNNQINVNCRGVLQYAHNLVAQPVSARCIVPSANRRISRKKGTMPVCACLCVFARRQVRTRTGRHCAPTNTKHKKHNMVMRPMVDRPYIGYENHNLEE